MCRSLAEGGRRCPGGHDDPTSAARQQLQRARRALARAKDAGDASAIAQATVRIAEAQDLVAAIRINAGQLPSLSRTGQQPPLSAAGGLPPAEYKAVSLYTGGQFGMINAYVQNGYRVPSYAADDPDFIRHMETTTAALERAVGSSPLPSPTRATRAIWSNTADTVYGPVGSGVGKMFTESRFTSTTTNDMPSRQFGDVTIVYHFAAGTNALDINSSGVPCNRDENELLAGPHQPLRMVSDRIVDGGRVITMESAPSQ